MQKRILKVLLAFMLIMSMTLSNFLLIGISTVNAVEEIVQEKNTNNKNVEFMAYFKDEQGNKVSTYSSKTTDTDLKLYLSVSVKQEGYFNGAITLKDSNFKFKTDNSSDKISSITENNIKFVSYDYIFKKIISSTFFSKACHLLFFGIFSHQTFAA